MTSLADLERSHDADGAHSHLYATMVKIAGKTADKTVRRESRRRRDPRWYDGPTKGRRARAQAASGVGGYTRVATRRWLRRKTYRIRHRRNAVVAAAVLPVAIARTSYRAVRGTVRLTTAVVRAPMTILSWLIVLVLILLVVPLAFPGVHSDLRSILPSSTCGGAAQREATGARSIAYEAGQAANVLENPPDPVAIRDGILAGATAVGKVLGSFTAGVQGKPKPTEPVDPSEVPPGYDPRLQASAPATLAVAAPQAGTGSPDEAAAAILAAGQTGEVAATFVAIAGAESEYVREARNPTSSARGYWQLLTRVHGITEAQAFDPLFAAKFAVGLRDASPAGFAGPWAETFGRGLHAPYMAGARAAVARAQGAGAAASAVPAAQCVPNLGAPGGVMQASLSDEGLSNGALPPNMLAPLSWAPGHSLRPEAARAAEAMNAAYRSAFGVNISVTDSYRTLAGQRAVFADKPGLAAEPGTSEHGWGKALDLGGGVQTFGTPQHEWVVRNGPTFGWFHPEWAKDGNGREEPWHHEFGDNSAQRAG
jgi:hypothetical protein